MWNLPGPGIEPTPLHWLVDSHPLCHQGSHEMVVPEQLPKHCSYMLSLPLKELGESFSGWRCFYSSPCVCQRSRCDSRTRILHVSQPAVHLAAPKLSWTSEVSFASFFQWLIYHFGFSTVRGEKLRFMWGGKRPFTSFILLVRKMASSVFIHSGKK